MVAFGLATGSTIAAVVGDTSRQDAARLKKAGRPCINRQLCNTKLCVYFMKGACTYGDACTFAHSSSSLQDSPDLQKTRLCKAFLQGACNDSECRFAHGEKELRSTGNFFKKTLCIWFEKSKCRNGQQCRFAHGLPELQMHESKSKAGAAPGADTPKKKTPPAEAGAGHLAKQRSTLPRVGTAVPTQHLNHHEPMKVMPPSMSPWPTTPPLEYTNTLYTSYMVEHMMQRHSGFAQKVEKAENDQALAEEFGRLHEHIRALSLQCNMLQQQMLETTDGISPSTASTTGSGFSRGTSEGSSSSQDIEPLSFPPGLQ
jgi:hypothetical protein